VSEPVIRQYRESDLAEATAFLRANFDPWPPRTVPVSPEEHLRWKLSSHELAPIGQWVAEDEGRLVATHFSFVQGAWFRGREVLTTTGGDSAVEERFRGQHLYTQLRETRFAAFREAFELRFSRGAHVAVNRARDRAGEMPFANEIEVLEAPTGGDWRNRLRGQSPRSDAEVVTLTTFDHRVDRLWEGARQAFDLVIERTAKRLNWRYADPRSGRAEIRALPGDASSLRGYTVLRVDGRRARLVDVFAHAGDADGLRRLLLDAIACARAAGATAVRAWLPREHVYRPAFAAARFAVTGQVAMRFAPSRASAEEVAHLAGPRARIYLAMGDTDAG